MKGLKTLALSGRTVLCTIHSPSPSLFEYFDKLLLLSEVRQLVAKKNRGNFFSRVHITVLCLSVYVYTSLYVPMCLSTCITLPQGHVLFFGPASECKTYLVTEGGFPSSDMSPADFVIHAALQTRDQYQVQDVGADRSRGIGSDGAREEQQLQSLTHLAALAEKTFYASADYEHDLPLALTLPEGNTNTNTNTGCLHGRLWRSLSQGLAADVQDVRKSGVTMRILLYRETLKELRRARFWITNIVRAVALGALLGINTKWGCSGL